MTTSLSEEVILWIQIEFKTVCSNFIERSILLLNKSIKSIASDPLKIELSMVSFAIFGEVSQTNYSTI